MSSYSRWAWGVLLALLLAAIVLMLWRRHRPAPSVAPPTPIATAAVTVTAVPSPTVLRAPSGYRLAGVAVGEPDSFAVVESPNGRNTLYRRDADIPGLGRLVRIEAERIVVQSDAGQFDLWLTPAATPTPTRHRTVAAQPPTAKPAPRTAAARTTPGSKP